MTVTHWNQCPATPSIAMVLLSGWTGGPGRCVARRVEPDSDSDSGEAVWCFENGRNCMNPAGPVAQRVHAAGIVDWNCVTTEIAREAVEVGAPGVSGQHVRRYSIFLNASCCFPRSSQPTKFPFNFEKLTLNLASGQAKIGIS